MKTQNIIDALNLIDDNIINEAYNIRFKGIKRRKNLKHFACFAACACVAFGVFVYFKSYMSPPSFEIPYPFGDMGVEGYISCDISESETNIPLTEHITKLPVYKNPYYIGKNAKRPLDDKSEDMYKRLYETAELLGIDKNTLNIEEEYNFENDLISLIAVCDELTIDVGRDLVAYIDFNQEIKTDIFECSEYVECRRDFSVYIQHFIDYIKEEFSSVIQYDNPTNIYSDIYVNPYTISFFDKSGDYTQQIINYSFNKTTFYVDDYGNIHSIRIYKPDLSEKLGDYEIISLDEAYKLLENEQYMTDCSYPIKDINDIKKVELVYKQFDIYEYFAPFYEFYVESPETDKDGLKTYNIYYVPAVDEKYISNFP